MANGAFFTYDILLHLGAQHARCKLRLIGCRSAVVDVQYRTQFIAEFGFKPSGRKSDRLDHVWVGEGQPFLLPRTHQKWTVHLNIVDVDQVLIK